MSPRPRKRKRRVSEADRPRVHGELHPEAASVEWGKPSPPPHGGDEELVRLRNDLEAGVYVDNGEDGVVHISPGEAAYVPTAEARRLEKEGLLGKP